MRKEMWIKTHCLYEEVLRLLHITRFGKVKNETDRFTYLAAISFCVRGIGVKLSTEVTEVLLCAGPFALRICVETKAVM